jgi:hypothetical protein
VKHGGSDGNGDNTISKFGFEVKKLMTTEYYDLLQGERKQGRPDGEIQNYVKVFDRIPHT